MLGNTFLRNRANGLQVITNGTGSMDVEVDDSGAAQSTFDDNNIGVSIAHNSSGTFSYGVRDLTIDGLNVAPGTGGSASPININLASAATTPMVGRVTGNTVTNSQLDDRPRPAVHRQRVGDDDDAHRRQHDQPGRQPRHRGHRARRLEPHQRDDLQQQRHAEQRAVRRRDPRRRRLRATDTTTICADIRGNTATTTAVGLFGIRARQERAARVADHAPPPRPGGRRRHRGPLPRRAGRSASAAGVPSYLTRSAYAGLADPPFAALTAGGLTTTLRLTEVADLARAGQEPSFAGRDDAFALLFSGPADVVLDSGIHELRNPALGAFSVFISPVQAGGAGEQRYEVVVDRSVRLASALQDAPEPMALSNAVAAAAPARGGGEPAGPAAPRRTADGQGRHARSRRRKPAKLVQSALLARRGGELTVDVRVARGRGLVSVRAVLLRDGVEHARAARRLKGRAGIRLHLREVRPTPLGDYRLKIIVTDRHGKRTSTTRRVTVS